MRVVLVLLILAVVLAVLKALLIPLAIALLLALAYALITRPRDTLLFLGTLTLLVAANAQPIAFIFVFGVLGVVALAVGAKRK